ncbi:MAG: hypothetical protein V1866_03840 [archaeon]
MKKQIFTIIGILLLAVMLTGCMKYYVCPDGSRAASPSSCAPKEPVILPEAPDTIKTETKPEEAKPKPLDQKDISADAQALFDKSTKVTSVQFNYVRSPDSLPQSTFYVTKDRIKVVLTSKTNFPPEAFFDVVYLNRATGTATGYCENIVTSGCPDRNKPFSLEFEKYVVETPLEWIAKLTKAELTGQSKMVNGRTGKEVKFEIDGNEGSMFVDSFFGLPLMISYQAENYEFRDLAINEVKPTDIEHQTVI